MATGLAQLGFWLAAGIVVAAMIVSGAIKARDRERDSQATARAIQEQRQAARQALLENAGDNITEVLAYLREKDAAAAAKAEAGWRRMKTDQRRGRAFAAAIVVGVFSFMGGLITFMTLQSPSPAPTGWAAVVAVGIMLGIWAAGLIIAALIWSLLGRPKHDAQPDA